MGSYFSKDYYTNEEKIEDSDKINSTPKFRILKDDPRSATLGIVRTPLQVEATPRKPPKLLFTSPAIVSSTTDADDHVVKEDLLITDHENTAEQLTNENGEFTSEINSELDEDETKNKLEVDESGDTIKNKPLERRYLETNLDDFITSPLCDTILQNEKFKESEIQSPTEVSSTDIPSVSPYTNNTTTLLDVSDCMDDPSAIVTDNDESFIAGDSEPTNMSINEWLAQMENEMSCCSLTGFVSPQKSIDNQAPLSDITANKKLFLTPDAKTSSPAKVRTPLKDVKKNLLVDSPSLVIKRKQWRCIQEERVKRGLSLDDENTPPPMPPFSNLPASAPGKMMQKRRIAEWDKDSTVLI